MKYKHGNRAKHYRLHHLRWQRLVALSGAGLLTAVLVGFAVIRFSSLTVAQALGFDKKHSAGVKASVNPTPMHKPGSNAPPPKGAIFDKYKADSTSMKLRKLSCDVYPPAHPGLVNSSVPELQKLAQYEQLCNGTVAGRTSFFISTPTTAQEAQSSGRWVANNLKAYAASGVKPLIFMEPTFESGGNIDLTKLANGTYDTALTDFYQTIKTAGITNNTMGMWVYLPEDNMPNWTTTDPAIYTKVVTKLAKFQKQIFPGSEVSLMLDSASYAPGASWGDGKYTSLLPYVKNIPAGLIDSFGLQGFPWSPPANSSEAPLNVPKAYLQSGLAVEAARKLGIKNIWFNTGTFHEMYAGQPGQTIYETDLHRQQELDGVLQLASEVKSQGFNVSIHLFSQNKAALAEGTDWSYWKNTPGDRQSTYVFTTFAHDAETAGIPIWLYDTTGN